MLTLLISLITLGTPDFPKGDMCLPKPIVLRHPKRIEDKVPFYAKFLGRRKHR